MRSTDSLERPWCWERLKAKGEGEDNRGWDGWMASATQWTWVWVKSRSWWWTGSPGMLQPLGLQRGRQVWVTELNTQKLKWPTHLAKILGIICYFIFTTNPHILRRLKKKLNFERSSFFIVKLVPISLWSSPSNSCICPSRIWWDKKALSVKTKTMFSTHILKLSHSTMLYR